MNGLVSIITPSYNTANFIGKTIESVLAQTYQNWEMIIIDDCSNDNTDEVVNRYTSDKRIKYIKNYSNVGAAMSRNFALREAKGKWIAFLDSDDLWDDEKLEKQIHFMESKKIYFSYTNYEEIDESGQLNNVKITGPKKISKQGMYHYCWPGCLTVMYDADYIGLVQIRDIKKNNDYALWLKICKKADCWLLEEYLAQYRRGRRGSISSHSIKQMIMWHYKLWHEVEGNNIIESLWYTCLNLVFGYIKKIKYVKR